MENSDIRFPLGYQCGVCGEEIYSDNCASDRCMDCFEEKEDEE